MSKGWKVLAGIAAVATAYVMLKDDEVDLTTSSLERTSNPNIKVKTTYKKAERVRKVPASMWRVEFVCNHTNINNVKYSAVVRRDGDHFILDSVCSPQLDVLMVPIINGQMNVLQQDAIDLKNKMVMSTGERTRKFLAITEIDTIDTLLRHAGFRMPKITDVGTLV